MGKFKTSAVYKVTQEARGKGLELGNLYLKNVPVTYAQVQKPGKKYNSEDTAYSMNIFIDAKTKDQLDDIGLNKSLSEVGVTKIKKGNNRGQVKYPLDDTNADYEGMFAAQFARNTVKRDAKGVEVKKYAPLNVVGADGLPFTQDVGNGSVCTVKLFAYRNTEDMLVVMLDTVVVLDHVPYEGGGDYYDEELGITVSANTVEKGNGMDPELVSSPQEKPESDFEEDFDDDVPF
jgi:hypothetical protein